MSDNIYKIIDVVGSSATSIEDAIERAIKRASSSLEDIRWFEVKETRGHVEAGRVAHYQDASARLHASRKIVNPGKDGFFRR